MKKTFCIIVTVAILCAALFRVEFVAKITMAQEPETVSPDVVDSREDAKPPPALKIQTVTLTTESPFDSAAYPEGYVEQVSQVEKDVKENDGLALIARIVDADGKPVKRVDFHAGSVFHIGPGEADTMTSFPHSTKDGWLRTNNLLASAMGRDVASRTRGKIARGTFSDTEKFDERNMIRFVVYTATHRPAVIKLPVAFGTVYYADIKLEKTPDDELVTISGIVLEDGTDSPIEDAAVYLRIANGIVSVPGGITVVPGGVGATQGLRRTATDKDGRFSFEKVTPQVYQISVAKSGHSPTKLPHLSPEQLEGTEHVFRYYKQRDIEIEYVFQSDGSRDFTKGNLQPRTVTLHPILNKGFRFATGDLSTGTTGTPEGRRDIDFRDNNGSLAFHQVFYTEVGSGFYDAGEVPFDSVTEADADPLVYPNPSTQSLPVNLNHVYVVKTLDGKYAKFVVRKIITE